MTEIEKERQARIEAEQAREALAQALNLVTSHTASASQRAAIARLDRETLRTVAIAYRARRQEGASHGPTYEAAVAELHSRAPHLTDQAARRGVVDHRPGRNRGAGLVLARDQSRLAGAVVCAVKPTQLQTTMHGPANQPTSSTTTDRVSWIG
jgi:hypothetical protein